MCFGFRQDFTGFYRVKCAMRYLTQRHKEHKGFDLVTLVPLCENYKGGGTHE